MVSLQCKRVGIKANMKAVDLRSALMTHYAECKNPADSTTTGATGQFNLPKLIFLYFISFQCF